MTTTAQRFADAVEAGRAAFPTMRVAREAFFRRRRASFDVDVGGDLVEEAVKAHVTHACIVGFAMLGGWRASLSDVPIAPHCPVRGCGASGSVIHLNDDHRWKPERIVAWLRSS